MMRKFYAVLLSVLTLLVINVPVAQCSMNNSIVIGHARCMAVREAMVNQAPNTNHCPMQRPHPASCHMTLIHKGWNTASIAMTPPVPPTIFLYALPSHTAHWIGGIKSAVAGHFPSWNAPPILSTKCTLNI